ncbi:bacteriocin immunity protein [Streptococcus hyovaginalis]
MTKKKKDDINKWLIQLEELLEIEGVQSNATLKKIFEQSKKDIEEDGHPALARLSNTLSFYLVTHQYKGPKEVIEFAGKLVKEPHKERGKLATLQMLALSLFQLK